MTPASIRVGTCGWGMDPQAYVQQLDVVELAAPVPLADARAWRAAAPDGFAFTLEADPAITRSRDGAFADTPAVRRAWKATLELARALDAGIVVLRCARGFRPTDGSVADLTRFCQWAHRDRLRLGWAPRGEAWTDELVGHLCRELTLAHVVDPFERECRRPRPPYFRLAGITGRGHRFTDAQLDELLDACHRVAASPSPPEAEAWCLFANASRVNDAQRMRALAAHHDA